jgi:hypothetical protein
MTISDAVHLALADTAAAHGVPVEAVLSAALHTFDMLDADQKLELIEEALVRMKAARACDTQVASGGLTDRDGTVVLVSQERDQMRNDLVYRLMHERFDLIYAIAVRAADAPEGAYHHQWLVTPSRPSESQTPPKRAAAMLHVLATDLRHSRRRFEELKLINEAKARVTP